jgi:hypothetical protein
MGPAMLRYGTLVVLAADPDDWGKCGPCWPNDGSTKRVCAEVTHEQCQQQNANPVYHHGCAWGYHEKCPPPQ